MQGLGGDSGPFRTPEKAGVTEPFLILAPRLAFGTPKNAGVTEQFRPLLGPQLYRGEVATCDFSLAIGVGDFRQCRGYIAIPPSSGPLRRQG